MFPCAISKQIDREFCGCAGFEKNWMQIKNLTKKRSKFHPKSELSQFKDVAILISQVVMHYCSSYYLGSSNCFQKILKETNFQGVFQSQTRRFQLANRSLTMFVCLQGLVFFAHQLRSWAPHSHCSPVCWSTYYLRQKIFTHVLTKISNHTGLILKNW